MATYENWKIQPLQAAFGRRKATRTSESNDCVMSRQLRYFHLIIFWRKQRFIFHHLQYSSAVCATPWQFSWRTILMPESCSWHSVCVHQFFFSILSTFRVNPEHPYISETSILCVCLCLEDVFLKVFAHLSFHTSNRCLKDVFKMFMI